jgi:hypothetical protein
MCGGTDLVDPLVVLGQTKKKKGAQSRLIETGRFFVLTEVSIVNSPTVRAFALIAGGTPAVPVNSPSAGLGLSAELHLARCPCHWHNVRTASGCNNHPHSLG